MSSSRFRRTVFTSHDANSTARIAAWMCHADKIRESTRSYVSRVVKLVMLQSSARTSGEEKSSLCEPRYMTVLY
jgi:hypothetical protein